MVKKRFLKIYVEITNICNFNCIFCSKSLRKNRTMSVDEFEIVADKISPYTNLIALHVKGEPLLHQNLKDILYICEKNNLKVNITTNGSLLSDKIDIIMNSKAIRQVNISLHSFSQNGLDSEKYLEEVLKASEKIKENGKIIISYRLWNLFDFNKNNVNRTILSVIGNTYKIDNIIELARNNEFIKLSKNVYLNQDLQFEWPDLNQDIISEFGKCYGLRKQLGILSNGDVVPCCLDSEANIKLGNIYENSMEEILESEKSKKIIKGFQEGILIEDLCQKCGFIKKFNNRGKIS